MRGGGGRGGGGEPPRRGSVGNEEEGVQTVRLDTANRETTRVSRPHSSVHCGSPPPPGWVNGTTSMIQTTAPRWCTPHSLASAEPPPPPTPPLPLQRTESFASTAQLIFFFPSVARTKHTGPSCIDVPKRAPVEIAAIVHRHTPHTTERQTPKRAHASSHKDAATHGRKTASSPVSAGRGNTRRCSRRQRPSRRRPTHPLPLLATAPPPHPPEAAAGPHVQSAASWLSARPGKRASSKSTLSRTAFCGRPACHPPTHTRATHLTVHRERRDDGNTSGRPDHHGAENKGGEERTGGWASAHLPLREKRNETTAGALWPVGHRWTF